MEKTERLNLVLTPEEMKKLEELAEANAGENKSLMVRKLISLAWLNPTVLDLNIPKAAALIGMAN